MALEPTFDLAMAGDLDPAPRAPLPAEDGYDAAMRAADALFSPKPQSAAPQTTTVSASNATANVSDRPAGRILQAIEQAPSDPFAELEALHAPKRRGRKPGSKNKPKAPVRTFKIPDAATPTPPPIVSTAAAPQAARAAVQAARATSEKPRGERFGWVRTTLRPGERWKRRLPKVAW